MPGITLETARNVAVVVALGLVAIAVVAAWLVKKIVAKLITVGVLAALALLVWSQRSSLDDCADRVQERMRTGAVDEDTTCRFFGQDVTVAGRGERSLDADQAQDVGRRPAVALR